MSWGGGEREQEQVQVFHSFPLFTFSVSEPFIFIISIIKEAGKRVAEEQQEQAQENKRWRQLRVPGTPRVN